MAGLMTAAREEPMMQGMAGPGMGDGMQPGMQPGMGDGMGNGMKQAGPEQQQLYEQFVAQAMKLIYSEDALPAVLKTLQGGGDPVEGLASAASLITFQVSESAEANGFPVSNDIVFNAGTEIFNQLADVADAAGFADFENDRDALESAYFKGLDQFRGLMQETGRIDQQASMRDVERLQSMSDSGELEMLLNNAAESDPRMPQGNRPNPEQAMM